MIELYVIEWWGGGRGLLNKFPKSLKKDYKTSYYNIMHT